MSFYGGLLSNCEKSKDLECSICFEDITNEKTTKILCNHVFHTTCINTWTSIKNTCPICRKIVSGFLQRKNAKDEDVTKNIQELACMIRLILKQKKTSLPTSSLMFNSDYVLFENKYDENSNINQINMIYRDNLYSVNVNRVQICIPISYMCCIRYKHTDRLSLKFHTGAMYRAFV